MDDFEKRADALFDSMHNTLRGETSGNVAFAAVEKILFTLLMMQPQFARSRLLEITEPLASMSLLKCWSRFDDLAAP
jgi:hypothetical protein